MNIQELLALLQEDTEIVITEDNIPLARLTSVHSSSSRIPDLHPNAITISDNFDEPLPSSDSVFSNYPVTVVWQVKQ